MTDTWKDKPLTKKSQDWRPYYLEALLRLYNRQNRTACKPFARPFLTSLGLIDEQGRLTGKGERVVEKVFKVAREIQ